MVRIVLVVAVLVAVLVASLLVPAVPAHANGILLSGTGAREPHASKHPVRLQAHVVKAKLTDLVAEVTVEQTFLSHATTQLEGTYLFPLPEGAVVSQFAMTMGGKMVEGEVVEAKRAKRIYEGIVRRRQDPGLLEYVGKGLFRARVFPIESHKPLTIRLTFQLVAKDDSGTMEFRYPLATDRMNGAAVGHVSVAVDIESTVDLRAIYSPSHQLEIVRDGARKAAVRYESRRARQTNDLLLYVERNPEDVGFSVLSQKAAGQDGTFMAVLTPPQTVSKAKRVPKDVVFVVDTSGSMAGVKMAQARKALRFGVNTLNAEDRFHILSFATSVRPFRDGLLPASDDIKAAASKWVGELESSGGTNLEEALRMALRAERSDRALTVVLLTDGKPSVGRVDAAGLLKAIKEEDSKARVHTFGVGYDLDVNLLDRIAEATNGTRDYVAPHEGIEIVTGRFFRKVKSPVFSGVTLDLGPDVYDVYPKRLGDLFAGSQVVVYGRYRKPGERTARLSGTASGGAHVFKRNVTLIAEGGPEHLLRLWANRKVAYLLDEIRLHGRNKEVVDEVVTLATRFAIVTPYTSGLVVEDEPVIRDEEISDFVETDNDLGANESFGESRGMSNAPFAGPASNDTIGIGGGTGSGAFRGRGGGRDLGTGGGGRKKFDDTVDGALRWLAAHQSLNGGWDAEEFSAWCDGKPREVADKLGAGKAENSAGLTGLAVSAFLGAGYTNRGKHDFARVVGMALRHLKNIQDPEGCFAPRASAHQLLQHAWATLALVEAYAMTGSPIFRNSAQRGLEFLEIARAADGLWGTRLGAKTVDAEVTTWVAYVLSACDVYNRSQSARGATQSRLFVPQSTAVQAWSEGEGTTPRERAQRLLVRTFLHNRPKTRESIAAGTRLVSEPPVWRADMSASRWHHGTFALFQLSGSMWDKWKNALEAAVVDSQRTDTKFCQVKGSWDPIGAWASEGGRIYMTAMMTRCVEVFYAYDRRLGTSKRRRAKSAPQQPFTQKPLTKKQRAEFSKMLKRLKEQSTAAQAGTRRTVGGRTFALDANARWVDTAWDRTQKPQQVEAMSVRWFELAGEGVAVARILALGERVVFSLDDVVYEVVPATN